jgi:hypothetical protein
VTTEPSWVAEGCTTEYIEGLGTPVRLASVNDAQLGICCGEVAPVSNIAMEWPATGIARFDQKVIESSAWERWKANLERRRIRVVPNPGLGAGNPANFIPGPRVLEYNPETFRYIDLLHESRHIAQFERAAAKGLDIQAPFRSVKLRGWLERGALDYEARLGTRFGFSEEYMGTLREVSAALWSRTYQKQYGWSPRLRRTLDQWWK